MWITSDMTYLNHKNIFIAVTNIILSFFPFTHTIKNFRYHTINNEFAFHLFRNFLIKMSSQCRPILNSKFSL